MFAALSFSASERMVSQGFSRFKASNKNVWPAADNPENLTK
jgi:hypothetical protein